MKFPGTKSFPLLPALLIIRSARTPRKAVEAAKKRFARLERIRDWKIHAALIEIEPIEVEVEPADDTPLRERLVIHTRDKYLL